MDRSPPKTQQQGNATCHTKTKQFLQIVNTLLTAKKNKTVPFWRFNFRKWFTFLCNLSPCARPTLLSATRISSICPFLPGTTHCLPSPPRISAYRITQPPPLPLDACQGLLSVPEVKGSESASEYFTISPQDWRGGGRGEGGG